VRLAVPHVADWGRHVDHSFDELGLLAVRHRRVAALELVARQAIAGAEGRDAALGHGRSRHQQEWNGAV
jgi:hypothetical protein